MTQAHHSLREFRQTKLCALVNVAQRLANDAALCLGSLTQGFHHLNLVLYFRTNVEGLLDAEADTCASE